MDKKSNNKLKVCFVSHSAGMWGAERFLVEATLILQDKVDATVLLPKSGKMCQELQKNNIKYTIIPYTWWVGRNTSWVKKILKLFHNLVIAIYIAYKLRKCKFDVIFTYTCTTCVGAIAAKILGIRHLCFIQEFLWKDHQLTFDLGKRFSISFIEKFSKYCLVNSLAVYNQYSKNMSNSNKWKITYQPVYLHFSPQMIAISEKKYLRCMILGAIKENKGQRDAIAAVCWLKEKYSINVELYVIGDGEPDYVAELKNMRDQNNLGENIQFVSYVDFPASWMQETDILLVCSKNEAYGRVTVEALLLEKCVIGTNSGGTAELLRQSEGGLLYEPGNFEQLAEHIKTLYQNEELRKRLAQNGNIWVKNNISENKFKEELLQMMK